MPRKRERGVPEGIKQMSECLDTLLECGLCVNFNFLAISMQEWETCMRDERCSSGLLNSPACSSQA